MSAYDSVPKDIKENLKYRLSVRKQAAKDSKYRAALRRLCMEDARFFFNVFCYLYEPRPKIVDGKKSPHVIPFVTWPHQDKAIVKLEEKLGVADIGIEKSRGEGASWIALMFAVRDWLYRDMCAIGLVSRTMDAADSAEDPDSLFWKIDWELKMLPKWMAGVADRDWKRQQTRHSLVNLRNGATITAYAATGDVASGGRKTYFIMDELAKFGSGPDEEAMASTQHVTESRLVISTPKGSQGAYYELMHEPSNMTKIVLAWEDNPTRNRGMYLLMDGKPVACSEDNPLMPEYNPPSQAVLDLFSRLRAKGYRLEGATRSPWFDWQCDRPRATPQSIAQELSRDYGGSSYRVFDAGFMDFAEDMVRHPIVRGELELDGGEPRFTPRHDGPFKMWCELDAAGRPPDHQYAVGCDISTGLGGSYTSNSVIQVVDCTLSEQVLEFAINTMDPGEFADLAMLVGKWFHGAYLAWEHNGPGAAMTARVMEKKYPNVYKRAQMWKKVTQRRKMVGFWTNDQTKEGMFGDLKFAVRNREFSIRSESCVKECGQYIRQNGKIVHAVSAKTEDDSSKGTAHGDRVIALCIAFQAMKDRPVSTFVPDLVSFNGEPPKWTIAHRFWESQNRMKADKSWDGRSTSDMRRGRV